MGKYDFSLNINGNDPYALILNKIKSKSTILEFGPYKGRAAKYLKEILDCKVYAVESDGEAAKECSKYTEEILVSDIEAYEWIKKWENIRFDGMIFADVLEHLRKPEDVLRKARQLLKLDGSIYISIPNITHNSIIINMINNKFNYTSAGILDQTHIHFWGYDNFIKQIYKAGMVPVTQEATYCGMDNEAGADYSQISPVMHQELMKRRYGHIYQFVFELKKEEYVKNNKICIVKDLRGAEQYQYRIFLEGNAKENFAGDFYFQCLVYDKEIIQFDIDGHAVESVRLNITGYENQMLRIFLKGILNGEEERLKITGELEYEDASCIINEKKFFEIPLRKAYEKIKLSIEREDVTIQKYYLLFKNYKEKKEAEEKLEKEKEKLRADFFEKAAEEEKIRFEWEILKKENEQIQIENRNLKKNLQEFQQMKMIEVCRKLSVADRKIGEFFGRMKYRFFVYAIHPRQLARRVLYKEVPIEAFVKKCRSDHMKERSLVSVVIPIYDRTTELRESIASILNQTYQNIELLLVCDGSPKETLEVVAEYKDNEKVRIFKYNNNSGNAVRGRNKAIKEAKGKYLAFQDSDDIAEPYRIEKSLQYLEEFQADVVYGAWRAKIDGTRDIGLADGQEIISPDCDYELLKEICVPCQSTVMAKIEALRDVGGLKDKMRYREDHELWLRMAYFGYAFKAVPEVLTNLRIHQNNLELKFKENDEYWRELTMSEHKIKSRLPIKIGYVIAGCDISGGLSVTCTHANYLLSRGFDISFICTGQKHAIDWYPDQKVEIYEVEETEDNYDILIATYWTTAFQVKQMKAVKKIYFIQSDERKFYEENSVERKQVDQTYRFDFDFMTMARWCQDWLREEFGKEAYLIHTAA